MRLYEGMFILRQSFVRENREKALDQVRSIIAKHEGSLKYIDVWAERTLCYEINHVREAAYVLAYFEIDPAMVSKIERSVIIDDEILRCLVVLPKKNFDLEKFKVDLEEARAKKAAAAAAIAAGLDVNEDADLVPVDLDILDEKEEGVEA